MPSTVHTLDELAARFGLRVQGEGITGIHGISTLQAGVPGTLAFLANPAYRKHLANTTAAAVVLAEADAADCPVPCLIAANPYATYARIAALFETRATHPTGIHPTAVVAADARVATDASIGPHCVIGSRSDVGPRAVLGAGCVVGEDCQIGEDSHLVARVTLVCRVQLGARVLVHPGAVRLDHLASSPGRIAVTLGQVAPKRQAGCQCITALTLSFADAGLGARRGG